MTWWNASWGYRKKITLKCTTYVVHRIDTDHAIYVKQVAADSDFWGHVTAAGADVRFVAADDTTELKFYFQRFDHTNDLMDAYVLITDRFEPAADIDFYMYYGNAGASDAQDAANTLTNYLAVYHCDEGTGTAVNDKKGAYNATASSSSIWDTSTQKVGAAGLNPANSYYATQGTLLDTMPANVSVSFWFNRDASTNTVLMSKVNETDVERFSVFFYGGGELSFFTIHDSIENNIYTDAIFSDDTWYHFIASWDATKGKKLYSDGVLRVSDASATALMDNGTSTDFTIGSYTNGALPFKGKLDEFKVMSIGLDQDDAIILYRSENGDLQTYAAEETAPAVGGFMTGKKYW